MGPVLIWPNVNSVFQEILALTKLWQTEGNKRVILAISNIKILMIYDIPVLFGKGNSHSNFINTSHVTTNKPFFS